jgi:hypothetical protein
MAVATLRFPARRLILAGGFAVAVTVAPAMSAFIALTTDPSAPAVACAEGETQDVVTLVCVPSPNTPQPDGTVIGASGVPLQVDGIACDSDRSDRQCQGQLLDPVPNPEPWSSISASP